jgi:hypothetical protein
LLRFSVWFARLLRFARVFGIPVLWWFTLWRISLRRFSLLWFSLRGFARLLRFAWVLLPAVLLRFARGLRSRLFPRMRLSETLAWDFPRPQLLLWLLDWLRTDLRACLRADL